MTTAAQLHAPCLADLLEHPIGTLVPRAYSIAEDLNPTSAQCADHLKDFAEAITSISLEEMQEIHGRTFDLTPACTPFLSVHIFGEESFKRAEFMSGLAQAYARCGFSTAGEVPDHLAIMLRFAPQFTPEEWAEIGLFCFPVSLAAMKTHLNRSANPYFHLIEAIIDLLAIDFPSLLKEKPCSTSSFLAASRTLPSSSSSPAACGGCGQMPSAIPPYPLSF